jgi:LPS O-antigen subunit length determinant protein (WzzB/FepE family)
VDLQKLIESQGRPAERRIAADEAVAGGDSLARPAEIRQAQADRLRERIESLEKSKAVLIESIDSELTELKEELETRTRGIDAERKRAEGAAKAVGDTPGGRGRKTAEKAEEAVADPKERKPVRKSGGKDTDPNA